MHLPFIQYEISDYKAYNIDLQNKLNKTIESTFLWALNFILNKNIIECILLKRLYINIPQMSVWFDSLKVTGC